MKSITLLILLFNHASLRNTQRDYVNYSSSQLNSVVTVIIRDLLHDFICVTLFFNLCCHPFSIYVVTCLHPLAPYPVAYLGFARRGCPKNYAHAHNVGGRGPAHVKLYRTQNTDARP